MFQKVRISDKKIKYKNKFLDFLDENDDGKIDVNDIILKCVKLPGVKINREEFLRKELSKKATKEQVDVAIIENPSNAHIDKKFIDKTALKVIKKERIKVSSISAACSATGGVVAIASIPVDMIQYYGYLLRIVQKLVYLYGFPELDFEYDKDTLKEETLAVIIGCLGVMFGISKARKLIGKMAKTISKKASQTIAKKIATKPIILLPLIKSISQSFSKKITLVAIKEVAKRAIPVIGFIIGGIATYLTFNACCKRLRMNLQTTVLSDKNAQDLDDDDDDLEVEEVNEENNLVLAK